MKGITWITTLVAAVVIYQSYKFTQAPTWEVVDGSVVIAPNRTADSVGNLILGARYTPQKKTSMFLAYPNSTKCDETGQAQTFINETWLINGTPITVKSQCSENGLLGYFPVAEEDNRIWTYAFLNEPEVTLNMSHHIITVPTKGFAELYNNINID